jgi:hypothetical protein
MNGDPDLLLDALQLDLHLLAELQVERAQRLVEEQHAGPVDERPGEGDPLPLAAGELRGLALVVALEADHPERVGDPPAAFLLRDLLDEEAVLDVLRHGHVREQRVVLEHGVDVAFERRLAADVLAMEEDPALVGSSKPAIIRSVVVLPEPDGPSIEKNSPSRTSRSTWSTAVNDAVPVASSIAFATRLPWASAAKTLVRPSRRTAGTGAALDAGRRSGAVPGSAETAVGLGTANQVLGLGPEESTRRCGA